MNMFSKIWTITLLALLMQNALAGDAQAPQQNRWAQRQIQFEQAMQAEEERRQAEEATARAAQVRARVQQGFPGAFSSQIPAYPYGDPRNN